MYSPTDVKHNAASPAVTLDYTPSWDNKGYSIDFVPAIEFNGFPKESKKTLDMSWIPEEYIDGLCKKIHVVAKTHSSGEYGFLSVELICFISNRSNRFVRSRLI